MAGTPLTILLLFSLGDLFSVNAIDQFTMTQWRNNKGGRTWTIFRRGPLPSFIIKISEDLFILFRNSLNFYVCPPLLHAKLLKSRWVGPENFPAMFLQLTNLFTYVYWTTNLTTFLGIFFPITITQSSLFRFLSVSIFLTFTSYFFSGALKKFSGP